MPYTVPLDDPPTFPSSQAPIADASGKPTREFADFMNALREWIDKAQLALDELEP